MHKQILKTSKKKKQGKSTTTTTDRLFYGPTNHTKNVQKQTNKTLLS